MMMNQLDDLGCLNIVGMPKPSILLEVNPSSSTKENMISKCSNLPLALSH